jgi:tRNA/rRNA methyltransferase
MTCCLVLVVIAVVTVMFRNATGLLHFALPRQLPKSHSRRHVSDSNIAAFHQAQQSAVRMPCVILVNPFLDANVGSISRAMLNFGLHELRVVSPECNILSEIATTLAVGSVEVLRNAKLYDTLESCIADLDVVIATTARSHAVNQIRQTPAEAAAEIITANNSCRAGIVFGRERNGLSSEELVLANRRVVIPSFEHFGVLNLAQAVNILAYECQKQRLVVSAPPSDAAQAEPSPRKYEPEALATSSELSTFLQRLFQEMGQSERYRKVTSEEAAAGNISSHMVATEHDGVSGLTKKTEMRLATIFKRVSTLLRHSTCKVLRLITTNARAHLCRQK